MVVKPFKNGRFLYKNPKYWTSKMWIPFVPELYVEQNLTLILQAFWQTSYSYMAKHYICQFLIQETVYKTMDQINVMPNKFWMSNGREKITESGKTKSTDENAERDFINEEIKKGTTPL